MANDAPNLMMHGGITTMAPMPETTERIVNKRKVIQLRIARGWSQRDLARETGLTQSTISKVERGEMGKACELTRDRLAEALKVSKEQLAKPPDPSWAKDLATLRVISGVEKKKREAPSRKSARAARPQASLTAAEAGPAPAVADTPEKQGTPAVAAALAALKEQLDGPLVTAIIQAAAEFGPGIAWRDIQNACQVALETHDQLPRGADLSRVANVLLDSARTDRLKGGKGDLMAILAHALYRVGTR